MSKKSTFILLGLTAAAISYYIYKKKQSSFKSLADKHYANKDYSNAIYYYLLCLQHEQDCYKLDIYNKLSYCYIKLKQYNNSLDYLNLSLSLNLNPTTLKWRFECYKKLDMKTELCKDLFLYCRIINDQDEVNKIKEQAEILLKEICDKKCSQYLIENELFEDFDEYEYVFEPFVSLMEEYKENELVQLVIQKKYKDLHDVLFCGDSENYNDNKKENNDTDKDKVVKDDKTFNYNESSVENDRKTIFYNNTEIDNDNLKNENVEIKKLFKSMILFYKGFTDEAIRILENSKFKYSVVVKEYFSNSKKDEQSKKQNCTRFIEAENHEDENCTIKYFLYKITKDIKYIKNYKYNFIYPQLILHYISTEEYDKIEEIINTVDYSSYIPLLVLIGEYKIKSYQTLINTKIENPRIELIRALFYLEINKKEVSINILKNSIKKYPTFFKSYLYLGNLLMDNLEECENVFFDGMQYCCTYNELLVCQQAIMFVEIEKHTKIYEK